MNIIFMGSAAFAVPTLLALLKSHHRIALVVTQPDKPAGRGQELAACPVAERARDHKLALYQPTSLKTPDVVPLLAGHDADLFVVVAYGKFLPAAVLALPKNGCINVHASLLPKYRGAAPINWAIINGETTTGVTTMYIAEEMDAGDIILTSSTPIDECEMVHELHERLAVMGAELLMRTTALIEGGTVTRRSQDHAAATFAPILKKEDGRIDWSLPAQKIYNRFRGLVPWPGSFTTCDGKLLHIWEMAPHNAPVQAPPGTIIKSDRELVVATGQGAIYLLEVQLEGKKKMATDAFLRGHRIVSGATLS